MIYEVLKYYMQEVVDNAKHYRSKPIIIYWAIVGLMVGCLEIMMAQLELWREE